MVFKAITVLAIAAAAFLVFGCGGGGDSTLSKQEYDQKLELVCNKGLQDREEFIGNLEQKYERRNPKANAKEKAEEQSENLMGLMTVYEGTTEEIAEIGLPEKEEEKAEELVQTREDAAAKIRANPADALANVSTILAKTNEVAEELEVASCAR